MFSYPDKPNFGKIHFIGIGGIGLSALAQILHDLGFNIQGSDINYNDNISRLEKLGINIFINHNKDNIKNVDYIVVSSAITQNNVEIIEASKRNIPILKRSCILSLMTRSKYSICVSGSHGKTTTTSFIAHMLEYEKLNPSLILGGILNDKETNNFYNNSEYLVVEADESDGTFCELFSDIAVITNIDKEHISFYKTFEHLKMAFEKFINKLPFYGFAVLCYDDPVIKDIARRICDKKIIKYGISSNDLNVKALNIKTKNFCSIFDIEIKLPWKNINYIIKNVKINTIGHHNILNSLAAFSIGIEKNFADESLKYSLSKHKGVSRRFTKLGKYKGALIIDDYAHHPNEIKAVIDSAKLCLKDGSRIIIIFQPHRYSRLNELFDEFVNSFFGASKIFVSDIYSAGEQNIYGISNQTLIDAINKKYTKEIAYSFSYNEAELIHILDKHSIKDDLIIFMGAGTITEWPRQLQLD